MMVNWGEDVQTDYNYLVFSLNCNSVVVVANSIDTSGVVVVSLPIMSEGGLINS